ncbi:glycoprotein 3-alpha-L-fucosyltransferase A-like [Lytechinus pictus]|uniref:glycoprotein 3-alpha-L-fucosyltransferase A-like n=1 Tax=Lytechinus pictus TaxID=7653 RepID=UPI0030B9E513
MRTVRRWKCITRRRMVNARQQIVGMMIFSFGVFILNAILQTKSLQSDSEGPDGSNLGNRPVTEMTFEPFPDVSTNCVKKVHIFGNLTDMASWLELSSWYKLFKRGQVFKHTADAYCPLYNCTLRFTTGTNLTHLKGKDAVIFGALPKAFEGRLHDVISKDPEPGQTWFYYSTETPLRVVNWNRDVRIADLKYHKLMTYRSDSDIHIPFGYYQKRLKPLTDAEFNTKYVQNKTKLVAWMASNCAQIFWPRIPIVEQLGRRVQLDTYGRCGKLSCQPQRSETCNHMLKEYKFYMTLANSECHEYITEKFWTQTIGQGIVPVVYGAPKSDFQKMGPPNSFIHLSDYSSLKEMAEHLKKLNKDHESYMKYLEWGRYYEAIPTFPIQINNLCRIVPHLNKGTTQELHRLGDSTWYKGCRNLPNKDILTPFWPREQMLAYFTWTPWGSKRDGINRGTDIKPF